MNSSCEMIGKRVIPAQAGMTQKGMGREERDTLEKLKKVFYYE